VVHPRAKHVDVRVGHDGRVQRVVILGRGASGKSTLAIRLGELTGLPVVELDRHFWQPDLAPTPRDRWAAIQHDLTSSQQWIMDGDLGPYDMVEIRLRAADTIILLNFSLARCAWRALRRSRERIDFWHWLITYRHHSRPLLSNAINTHAAGAAVHIFHHPHALNQFIRTVALQHASDNPTAD
jgi:hypothetical protein